MRGARQGADEQGVRTSLRPAALRSSLLFVVVLVLGVLAAGACQALLQTQARVSLERDVDRAHALVQVMLDDIADGPALVAAGMRTADDPTKAFAPAVARHRDKLFGSAVLITGDGKVTGSVPGLPVAGGALARQAVAQARPVWSTAVVAGQARLVVAVPCPAWTDSAVELLVTPLEVGAQQPFGELSLTVRQAAGSPVLVRVGEQRGTEVARALDLNGLELQATYSSTAPLLTGTLRYAPAAVLLLGLVLAAVVALTVMALARGRRDALVTVDEQTVELRRLAYVDELTGLANRRALVEHLQTLDPDRLVAVAIVDVDHFKQLNDRAGHDTGDALLRVLGARLGALSADLGGFAARLGGDEFVVVAPASERADAQGLGRRVVQDLQDTTDLHGRSVTPSVSVGVHLGSARLGGRVLLKGADTALYAAKAAGRGCWRTTAHGDVPRGAVPRSRTASDRERAQV